MTDYTLYTHPMSRGQIARWALHEAGADYAHVLIDWADKPAALLAANPMGKIPTLVHHIATGDQVVTECAAICAYLAEAHPDAGLLPDPSERAAYHRWLYFAAGPMEQALIAQSVGWAVPRGKEATVGFGTFDRMLDALEGHLAANAYVCGDRFTMADVYVSSQIGWGLAFGSLPRRDILLAYARRANDRPAYRAARAIDLGEHR
jgi:glutathione S-transferase